MAAVIGVSVATGCGDVHGSAPLMCWGALVKPQERTGESLQKLLWTQMELLSGATQSAHHVSPGCCLSVVQNTSQILAETGLIEAFTVNAPQGDSSRPPDPNRLACLGIRGEGGAQHAI